MLQWDKDDCAAAGLVKFDLLGLGMLTMLHLAVDLVREHEGIDVDLATIPQEPAVYELLCAADTVGVFQVESRAQMATLPRLRPRTFYDLVIEVALIRPGPIQGGSVHPYLRRRNGQEPVTYPHPMLEELPGEDARACRCSRSSSCRWRSTSPASRPASPTSCARPWARSARTPAWPPCANGCSPAWPSAASPARSPRRSRTKFEAFADFGFPESHSVSFAYLVYSSSWIKLHYPAEFACALLNAQPMGFYSPHTIVRDAMRHGVEVLGPYVNASRKDCTLEPRTEAPDRSVTRARVGTPTRRPTPSASGLRYVRGLADALLDRIDSRAPTPAVHRSPTSPAAPARPPTRSRRSPPRARSVPRRDRAASALWAAGALRDARADKLPGVVTGAEAPPLPGMTEVEEMAADLWATGLSPAGTPPSSCATR